MAFTLTLKMLSMLFLCRSVLTLNMTVVKMIISKVEPEVRVQQIQHLWCSAAINEGQTVTDTHTHTEVVFYSERKEIPLCKPKTIILCHIEIVYNTLFFLQCSAKANLNAVLKMLCWFRQSQKLFSMVNNDLWVFSFLYCL